ncbi:DUF6476 family protein [Lacibacterium aquatile]|uniref:DUF6476 family protein n=1 Tax=Lacibacterium aquatile TaxID=1168082 RepID=A0ABW5DWA4_9PROT
MKSLKTLVIGMTTLLVLGMVALVYGIATKLKSPQVTEGKLVVPEGLKVISAGGNDAITLLTRDSAGVASLLLFDPKTGRQIGRFQIEEK